MCGFGCIASGSQLLTNGGFETGTLAGWTVANQAGSFPGGSFFAASGTAAPQSAATHGWPRKRFVLCRFGQQRLGRTRPAANLYGSDRSSVRDPLVQPFCEQLRRNIVNPIGLDFTGSANQHGRVDILTAGATAFNTTTGVLQNFYLGVDAGANPHAYTNRSFDITSLVGAGGAFQLRFAEVDNQNFLNMGVDNVSVDYTAATGVPEPPPSRLPPSAWRHLPRCAHAVPGEHTNALSVVHRRRGRLTIGGSKPSCQHDATLHQS